MTSIKYTTISADRMHDIIHNLVLELLHSRDETLLTDSEADFIEAFKPLSDLIAGHEIASIEVNII